MKFIALAALIGAMTHTDVVEAVTLVKGKIHQHDNSLIQDDDDDHSEKKSAEEDKQVTLGAKNIEATKKDVEKSKDAEDVKTPKEKKKEAAAAAKKPSEGPSDAKDAQKGVVKGKKRKRVN